MTHRLVGEVGHDGVVVVPVREADVGPVGQRPGVEEVGVAVAVGLGVGVAVAVAIVVVPIREADVKVSVRQGFRPGVSGQTLFGAIGQRPAAEEYEGARLG